MHIRRVPASIGDFFALLKPRVMSLVIFTGLAGIVVAPGGVHPLTAFTALLCIAVGAGASGALNMAYDSDIDCLMARTAGRPVPMGRVSRDDALAFGWALSVGAVATMGLLVNYVAAGLLAFTIFFYVGRLYAVAEAPHGRRTSSSAGLPERCRRPSAGPR